VFITTSIAGRLLQHRAEKVQEINKGEIALVADEAQVNKFNTAEHKMSTLSSDELLELSLKYPAEKGENLGEAQGLSQVDIAMAEDKMSTLSSDESYIALMCDNLAVLATVWADARSEAIDFANKLNTGLQVTTTPAFKLTVRRARETSVVLMEGLKAYGVIISS